MNGDGLKDVLIGSFSGVPQWIERTEAGYGEPTAVLDKNGDAVVISEFWNFETEDWDESETSGARGHCSSVAAVDWDADGDMDLLLGGYRNGGLFLRLNEGTATETMFASTSQALSVGGEPIAFEGGMGAPRVVDWDGDGLFDVLIGSIFGEVVLLRNVGSEGAPAFDEMTTLVELLPGKAGSKTIKRVATTEAGMPVGPGSSFHIEAVDYDGDGDLDLLVGGRSEWLTGPLKTPTAEELKRQKELKAESEAAWEAFTLYKNSLAGEDAAGEQPKTDKYRALLAKYHALRTEANAITKDPVERGDFVWLFRQK